MDGETEESLSSHRMLVPRHLEVAPAICLRAQTVRDRETIVGAPAGQRCACFPGAPGRGQEGVHRYTQLSACRHPYFFAFVAHREPPAIAQCAEITRIPVKKRSRPAMCYTDAEEIAAILQQPDRLSLEGQRNHALLAFLYNTGARIQEALDVCPRAIRFEAPAHVELLGRGARVASAPYGRRP
jgi:site-specific recombinase XerC